MQAEEPVERDGACHCGTVRFRVKLTDGFNNVRRCTCSYCRMRGGVVVSANVGDLVFHGGEDALTLYQFNTRVAQHYFCSKCGIYTHHRRRSNPTELSINVACLEGVSPFDFATSRSSTGSTTRPIRAPRLERVIGSQATCDSFVVMPRRLDRLQPGTRPLAALARAL